MRINRVSECCVCFGGLEEIVKSNWVSVRFG